MITPKVTPNNIQTNLGLTERQTTILRDLALAFNAKNNRKPNFMCVCTGNTCRSAACDDILKKIFRDTAVISSGATNARVPGAPMTPMVNEVLNKTPRGKPVNPMSTHTSRDITTDVSLQRELASADIIFSMQQVHYDAIVGLVRDKSKIITLGIKDPWKPAKTLASTPMSSQYGDNFVMTKEVIDKIVDPILNFFKANLGDRLNNEIIQNGFQAVRSSMPKGGKKYRTKTKSKYSRTKSKYSRTKSKYSRTKSKYSRTKSKNRYHKR
jgi:protein-tyrosine-phosphatase